jgi:uncharacterized protein (DUF433 family)
MATVVSPHIEIDEQGVARIAGTRTKVVLVIEDYVFRGWSPNEIHEQYPYLSLAQIHAAFSYYYDHKSEFDAEIEEGNRLVEEMAAQAADSPLMRKLRALKESRQAQ